MRNSTVFNCWKSVAALRDFFSVINSLIRFSVLVSWWLLEFHRLPLFMAINTMDISESIIYRPCEEGLMMLSECNNCSFILIQDYSGKENISTHIVFNLMKIMCPQ